jgi:hypothetical protein
MAAGNQLLHIPQPGLGIYVAELGGLDQRVDGGGALMPLSELANSQLRRSRAKPVHSSHVRDDVEVHYRWNPCFGRRMRAFRVE